MPLLYSSCYVGIGVVVLVVVLWVLTVDPRNEKTCTDKALGNARVSGQQIRSCVKRAGGEFWKLENADKEFH